MYSHSGHPRSRWVYFFIRTNLEKCNVTSLAHQCIICSEWVPSEWESKQLIKTSQSPTWHQFISCKGKSCMYVTNKSVKMLLQWKSPSLAVFSHTNPPTYLFRAILGCFIKYWKCLLLHLFLYPSVFHGFISYHDELDSCCDNDFYQLGLSFWRHPFSPEDSLQSKWCNAKCEVLMKTRWGCPDSICWAKFWQLKWRCC